jgi:hypothetical protein
MLPNLTAIGQEHRPGCPRPNACPLRNPVVPGLPSKGPQRQERQVTRPDFSWMYVLRKCAGNRPSEHLESDGGKCKIGRRQTRYFFSAELRLTRKIFPRGASRDGLLWGPDPRPLKGERRLSRHVAGHPFGRLECPFMTQRGHFFWLGSGFRGGYLARGERRGRTQCFATGGRQQYR